MLAKSESVCSTEREKSSHAVPNRPQPSGLLFADPLDPHARVPPTDAKRVHGFFCSSCSFAPVVCVVHAPLSPARSVAEEVFPAALDVRKQYGTFFERRGEYDVFMGGVDGNWPAEAPGKPKSDDTIVSAQV